MPTRPKSSPNPKLPPPGPAEALRDELMAPLGLSTADLAAELGIDAAPIDAVLAGSPLGADLALALERRFGASAEFWLNLQTWSELQRARDRQNFPQS